MRILKLKVLVFVAAGFALTAAKASADISLGTGNSAISGYTGPYGSVAVSLTDSTHATITFTSNAASGFLFGDGGSVAVNVNASSWTLGTITGSNTGTGFSPGPYSDGGSGNEDGFGSFNQTINSFDGFTDTSTTISFTLTNTSGTWADASSVLTANSDGNLVAAHIFVTNTPLDQSNGALATGYATQGDGGGGSELTPEPSSFLLMGIGALGLAGFSWRRMRRNRPAIA